MTVPPPIRPPVQDQLARPLADLRISVTDRCNFRCAYCMPREVFGVDHPFLRRGEILTYEEIERLARLFVGLGVRKLRLTGGEPLLRRDLPDLVRQLARLGVELTLTTNGALLAGCAADLKSAGLDRLTVSLDTLDPEVFRRIADSDVPIERVLEGIAAAEAAGFSPLKINAVLRRGVNDADPGALVRQFGSRGHIVRFIEYMDVGASNGWRLEEVVPAREILARLAAEFPLEPLDRAYRGEVATRYRRLDGGGEIGLITSVTQPFCGDCTRARLAADGHLYTCLFARGGIDLKAPLRQGLDDEALTRLLVDTWNRRSDRYSELRTAATRTASRIEMSYIGG